MTGRSDLDREMTAYLEARSTNRAPDGLLETAMTGVARTRQRPGWLILERWLPVRVTGGMARLGKAAVLLALLVLLVALAIAIAVVVAGSRHRLPLPFGLAKPGLIAFDLGGDIVVANPDGTGRTRLTSGPEADFGQTYSPDGTHIAYQTTMADMSTAVTVMDAHGQGRTTLADHLADVSDIVWAPDSRRIAFGARIMGSDASHIYVADIDRPGAIALGEPDLVGERPSWSPDGQQIAFKRTFPCCGASPRPDALWLMSADGQNLHELWTNANQIGSANKGLNNAFWNTAWSPDGKRLAFLAVGVGGAIDVFMIDADGKNLKQVSMTPQDEYWPSWSPDGSLLVFATMTVTDKEGAFVVVDRDGSNPRTLIGPLVNSNTAVWSPDGTRLFGYVYNWTLGYNDAIAVFDPTGVGPTYSVPIGTFGTVSWQRLAP